MTRRGTSSSLLATAIIVLMIVAAGALTFSYADIQKGGPGASSTEQTTPLQTTPTSTTASASRATSSTTASGSLSANCSGFTPVPQEHVGNLTPVILMQPNTVGYVCVTYTAAWAGDPSTFNATVSGWESLYLKNGSYPLQLYFGDSSGRLAPNTFNITATPESVRPSANVTSVMVLYRVAALSDSKGFYENSVPYGYCGSVPMAVGYSASQVNGSDFPPRPPPHSCVAEMYAPTSVGVSGIGVTLVDIPPSRLYLIGTTSTVPSCSESGSGFNGYVPCFTYNETNATVFNCLAQAATQSGCTVAFGSGQTWGYNVTVWYPATNQSLPWANCAYVVSNPSGQTSKVYLDCIPTGTNSFIIAEPPGPLT